jgi:hypothetical protein
MSALAPTHTNHFFTNRHRQNPDDGKVRPFDHEDMVYFSRSLFAHDTHLTLTLLPTQFGWLSHGKCSKQIVEASSIGFVDDNGPDQLPSSSDASHFPWIASSSYNMQCK